MVGTSRLDFIIGKNPFQNGRSPFTPTTLTANRYNA